MYEAGAPEAFRPYPLQYKVKKQSPGNAAADEISEAVCGISRNPNAGNL